MSSSHAESSDAHARGPLFALAGLLVLVLALYARTLAHGYVAYDDPVYVYENETVQRGLTLDGLRWALGFHAGNWHPLTWLTHMLDVTLFGPAPLAQHLVDAVLHALNAALLWLLVVRLTGARWTALFVAAAFALHPLRVESVAWISERKDVLAGTFWMLSLLAYERWARRGGAGRYALVCACLALGLMAKSMLVTLPVVMWLLDYWPLERFGSASPGSLSPARPPSLAPTHPGEAHARPTETRTGFTFLGEKLPLLALCLAAGSATLWIQQSEGAVGTLRSLTLAERASNAFLSYGVYVWKTFWPTRLACFVPHAVVVTPKGELARALFVPGLVCSALAALATRLAWRQRRARPHLLVGWLWYLVAAAPVIGFVQVGQQAYADRYTYLPAIGLALALGFELRALVLQRPAARPFVVGVASLALAALVPLTARQIDTWRDSRTLFAHALEVTEGNYLAATYLGTVERQAGELEPARIHLQQALAANKVHVPAMLELGLTLRDLDDLPGARRLLKQALRNDPGNEKGQRALREVEHRLGPRPPNEQGE